MLENIAARLGGAGFETANAVYKFAAIKKMKAEAARAHPEMSLIDMGVGEPDQAADPGIVAVLAEEAGKPENRYYADNGIPEFQEAAARYLEKVFGLQGIVPETDILHGIGSKPILAMLPQVFINPGDVCITTVPGYPVLATHARYLGGEVFPLPLRPENDFYPDFAEIPAAVLKRAKLLYLNYPNNPTGQTATRAFYAGVVDFAMRHRLTVISDASYAAITLDGSPPLSFLAIPGAREVGAEIHSLSKAFNMTGWRLAFLTGHPKLIKAYGTVKDNTDSGQFRAIQKAGVYALNHPEITERQCRRYARRMKHLALVLREVGFAAAPAKAAFYCYVPIPRGARSGMAFASAGDCAAYLIRAALIATVPWEDCGHYLRFSVTYQAADEEAENRVMAELKSRLLGLEMVF